MCPHVSILSHIYPTVEWLLLIKKPKKQFFCNSTKMYASDLPYVKLISDYSPLSPRTKLQRTLSHEQNEADIFDWYRIPPKPSCPKREELSKVEITPDDIKNLLAQAKQKVSQEKSKKKETTFRRLKKKLSKTLSS